MILNVTHNCRLQRRLGVLRHAVPQVSTNAGEGFRRSEWTFVWLHSAIGSFVLVDSSASQASAPQIALERTLLLVGSLEQFYGKAMSAWRVRNHVYSNWCTSITVVDHTGTDAVAPQKPSPTPKNLGTVLPATIHYQYSADKMGTAWSHISHAKRAKPVRPPTHPTTRNNTP